MRTHTREKILNLNSAHRGFQYKIWRQSFGWNRDNGKPWWYAELVGRNKTFGPFKTKAEAIRTVGIEANKLEKAEGGR